MTTTTRNRKTKEITLLIGPNNTAPYGFRCEHGVLWKPSKAELFKAIRWIYGVKDVVVLETFLSESDGSFLRRD